MKTQRHINKIVSLTLTFLLAFASLIPITASAVTITGDGTKIGDNIYLTSKTDYTVAPGISESHITTNNKSGNFQNKGYALEVDLTKKTGILASYKNYPQGSSTSWGMQTVRDQAAAASNSTGKNIVAAVNGDFFNMTTGVPTGPLVMHGTTYHNNTSWPYFAILKDGTAVIRSGGDYSDAQEVVGGPFIIVQNGKVTDLAKNDDPSSIPPRTSVGIKADGSVVFYVVDGRQSPSSCGMSLNDLAQVMISMGCVSALNLDGGGSSTFLSKQEGTDGLTCQNSPSDGTERTVSTALLIYSDAVPTGIYDHAVMTPNNEIYTPGSTVTVEATGVDPSGAAVSLPADGYFALDASSASMGTITTDGVFTANSSTGSVTVNYISGGKVTGTTTFEIQTPDSIAFKDTDISLAFNQQSELGLIVKYQDRDVNIKSGDIIWTLDDESMGTFSGNTFTASGSASINANITATSAFDASITGSVFAIIGRLPKVMWDFENPDDYRFATGLLNSNGGILEYTSGGASCNMLLGNYQDGGVSRGGQATAEVINRTTGKVRVGEGALKLNFDFSQTLPGKIEGACFGAKDASSVMDGTPTAIGMWLYAPEGTPNLWVRIRVLDGDGVVQTLDFTEKGSAAADGIGGINWTGWKYVEASLTAKKGPFKFLGGETVRLMFATGSYKNGCYVITGGTNADGTLCKKDVAQADCKGYVYVDDVQFVYGSNTQDVDKPVFDKIVATSQTGTSEDKLDINTPLEYNDFILSASFSDVKNSNTSGISSGVSDNYAMYLDGKKVSDDTEHFYNGVGKDDTIRYYTKLANGIHSLRVYVRDDAGNEAEETRYFAVNGSEDLPTVTLSAVSDSCMLNQKYTLALTTNDIADVSGITTTIKLDTEIAKQDATTVSFAEGFTGTFTYEDGLLAITAEKTGEVTGDTIATITSTIPYNASYGKNFSYRVLEGQIQYSDASILSDTFASANVAVPITAAYEVYSDTMLVGADGGYVYVKDSDGNLASGIDVFMSDGTLLGTTSKSGLFYTDSFTDSVKAFSLYANKELDYSFAYSSQSFTSGATEDGKPMDIISLATENPSTEKRIGWLSSPTATAEKSIVQYAEKSAYDASGESTFSSFEGLSTVYAYSGLGDITMNRAARINTVKVAGLKENTEYAYRCGDGSIWSDVMTFTTDDTASTANFFILGDIQAQDMTNINNVVKQISSDGTDYSFGIQVGDAVEQSDIYSMWKDILDTYSYTGIQSTDMIHAYGNHELFGDEEALSSKLMYGLNDEENKYYSVQYGNVYVAVINYQETYSEAEFLSALEWLKTDAKNAKAQWKILVTHSPAYNTNTSAYISFEHDYLPAAVQEAGINVVFSGHDHTYARTEPMTDGQVDNENGVVYYICGNSGEKAYTPTINPDYHFAKFIPRTDYTAVYLSVEATETEMTINVYDVNGEFSENVDTYTIKNNLECNNTGHKYVYDGTDRLTCSVCGHKIPVADYTGIATNENSGTVMYFTDGTPKTGWFVLGDDNYYFDENGVAQTGKITIDGHTYTFGADGKMTKGSLEKNTDGTYSYYINGTKQRGWFFIDGYWYYFSRTNSFSTLSGRYKVNKLYYTFSDDGKLIGGAWNETDTGTSYFWGPDPVTGWYVIDDTEGIHAISAGTDITTVKGDKYYFSPSNYYMCTDSVTLDGVVYSFGTNGVFLHTGAHHDRELISSKDATCTKNGEKIYSCTLDDGTTIQEKEIIYAHGHVDVDSNNVCDVCGKVIVTPLQQFFNNIVSFFKTLINALKVLFKIA